MDLTSAGLVIISLSWLIQLAYSWKGNTSLKPIMIFIYIIGVLILLIGIYISTKEFSYYQLVSLICSLAVLIRIVTLKKKLVDDQPKLMK
ncbi:MAG: hypothetical protein NTV30_09750 [Chloroflexi bacterium]|nr:hypothetical protein [Chloroflexota bacterium]